MNQQKLVRALLEREETVIEIRRKYVVMTYTKTIKCKLPLVEPKKFFIGTHGSLRIGRTYTESRPVAESLKWVLLNEVQE